MLRRKKRIRTPRTTPSEQRGPISVGDAIRAIVNLRPGDEATMQVIRGLLGIGREATTLALPNTGAMKPSSNEAISSGSVKPVVRTGTSASHGEARPQPRGAALTGIEVRLAKRGSGLPPPAPPAWADAGEGGLDPFARAAPPPPTPLFGPPRGRAILSTTLATVVDEGDIDLGRVVERLAGGQMLRSLPRLPSLTLRRGVQLLVDQGAGLDPFRADAELLVRHLDEILSDDRLEVLSFADCPSRGVGTGSRGEWLPWLSNRPGTPVVVVTDLAIGGPVLDPDRATVSEWLRFAWRVREAACELIALVPYEAGRWPPALARAMTVIHWSERTSVGSVRRARHEGHARLR
jgi:hypothetical protein